MEVPKSSSAVCIAIFIALIVVVISFGILRGMKGNEERESGTVKCNRRHITLFETPRPESASLRSCYPQAVPKHFRQLHPAAFMWMPISELIVRNGSGSDERNVGKQ